MRERCKFMVSNMEYSILAQIPVSYLFIVFANYSFSQKPVYQVILHKRCIVLTIIN